MPTPQLVYLAGPKAGFEQAQSLADTQGLLQAVLLKRRGITLGWVAEQPQKPVIDLQSAITAWRSSNAYVLPGYVADKLPAHETHIQQALELMHVIAEGTEVAELFEQAPYSERTAPRFEMLASFQDEGDDQEIETIEYDAVDGDEVIAENLWCKASWLSFEDDDASLRFRFSFGMVGYEDVATDLERQHYAAELTEAIFPESAIISQNPKLESFMQQLLDVDKLAYVERIVYFNAPNGGAQFHHDAERGHLGVVFAQTHGRTTWLACSKQQLISEIQTFLADATNIAALTKLMTQKQFDTLQQKSQQREQLNTWLDDRDNDPLERLLNHCPEFCQQMFAHGHGYLLNPGDIILLPQANSDECCWHTVFCIDDFPGEALSFAVRKI